MDNQGTLSCYDTPAVNASVWYNYSNDNDPCHLGAYIGKLSVMAEVTIQHNQSSYHPGTNAIDIYANTSCATDGSKNLVTNVTGSYVVVTILSSKTFYCANAS